jgi:hypothetical protein
MDMAAEHPLFANRFQAALFLLGLAAFWSGCLVLAVMELVADPHIGRNAQPGPGEAAAILVTAVGAIAVSIAHQMLLKRMTGGSRHTMGSMIRTLLPSTLADAARTLGLNGAMVAGALYTVLLVGVLTFFTAFIRR